MSRAIGVAAVAGLLVAAAGCGSSPPSHHQLSGVVLQVKLWGGFTTLKTAYENIPDVTILADGTVLAPRVLAKVDPRQTYQAVLQSHISTDQLQGLVDDAHRAGLVDPPPDLGHLGAANAPNITVRLRADGHTWTLTTVDIPPNGPGSQFGPTPAARIDFFDFVGALEKVPDRSSDEIYHLDRIAVFVRSAPPALPSRDTTPTVDWPVGDLSSGGTAAPGGARCIEFTGSAAQRVIDVARTTNEFTPWRSGGALWNVFLRGLVPGDPGCSVTEGLGPG